MSSKIFFKQSVRLFCFFSVFLFVFVSCSFADQFLSVAKSFVDKEEKVPLSIPNITYTKTRLVQGEVIELEATSQNDAVTFNWSVIGLDPLKGTPGYFDTIKGSKVLYTAPKADATGDVIISCYASKSGYTNSETKSVNFTIIKLNELSRPSIISSSNTNKMLVSKEIKLEISNVNAYAVYHWSLEGDGSLSSNQGTFVTYKAGSNYCDVKVKCYVSMEGYADSEASEFTIYVRMGKLEPPVIIKGTDVIKLKDGVATATFKVQTPVSDAIYDWKIVSGAGIINSSGFFSTDLTGYVTISCQATKDGYFSSELSIYDFAVISEKVPDFDITIMKDSESIATEFIIGKSYILRAEGSSAFKYNWSANNVILASNEKEIMYTIPDNISKVEIKCYASLDGYTDSEEAVKTYEVKLGKLTTPVIKVESYIQLKDNIATHQFTVQSPDPNVTYDWKIVSGVNGMDIGSRSGLFTSTVSGNATISCQASRDGYYSSDIYEYKFAVVSDKLYTPQIEIKDGITELIVGTGYTLQVKDAVSGFDYTWSVSKGGLSAVTGSSVKFTAPSEITDVTVTCYASKAGFVDSDKVSKSLTVKLGKLSTPVIKGDSYVQLKNSSGTFTFNVENQNSNETYNWSIVSGLGLINSSTGYFSTNASGDVTISCQANRTGYFSSEPAKFTFAVISTKLNTPQIEVKENSTKLISGNKYTLQVINPIDGFDYTWSVSKGGLSAVTGSSIEYTAPSEVADVTVTCYASKSGFVDSDNANLALSVKLGKLLQPTISSKKIIYVNDSETVSASSTDSGVEYYWSVDSGSISAKGQSVLYIDSSPGDRVIKCWTKKTDFYDSDINEFNLTVISNQDSSDLFVLDENDNTLYTESEPYDFGYSTSAIYKTFKFKNGGTTPITIYGFSSNNEASFIVTEKPEAGDVLGAGESVLFKVKHISSENETDGSIIITTNKNASPQYYFNVHGGSSKINVSLGGNSGYLLTGNGYDFGYNASSVTKELIFKNTGDVTINIDQTTVTTGDYSIVGLDKTTVKPNETSKLSVTYTPDTEKWSESDLKITSKAGREYSLRLIGSGCKLPSSISDMALWLRADKIRLSDTVLSVDKYLVNSMPDLSGRNGLSAYANGDDKRPVYKPNGINGYPSIEMNGMHHLISRSQIGSSILTGTNGSTSFVVFKTPNLVSGTRYILCPYGDTATIFPRIYWGLWYFNPIGGDYTKNTLTRKALYRFNISGYNLSRNPYDSNTNPVKNDNGYVLSAMYDSRIDTPNDNMLLWINGTKTPLAYLYTRNTTWNPNAVPPEKVGAHGLPAGDISNPGNINPVFNDSTASGYQSTYQYDYAQNLYDSDHFNAAFYNRLTSSLTYHTIRELHVGANYNNSETTTRFIGEISEIIMYDKPLSEEEMASVHKYLKVRYNIGN